MGLVVGNPENDFFDQNPELLYFSSISKLIQDKGKKEASRLMWVVYLLEDPNSKFYRIPREIRIDEVKKNYYNFKEEDIKDLVTLYTTLTLSKEESLFKIQFDKLEEMTVYLRELKVDDGDDLKKILDISTKLGKMWSNLEVAKKRMLESTDKSTIRAGAKESAREKRKTR